MARRRAAPARENEKQNKRKAINWVKKEKEFRFATNLSNTNKH